MKTDYDIIIIGAGASGLVAAYESSLRGLSSLCLEKEKKPGNKIYATGNGRCNLANVTFPEDCYSNYEFAMSVLAKADPIPDYFNKLGVPVTSIGNYLYPASLQSSTVVWALTDAVKNLGKCKIQTNSEVREIRVLQEGERTFYQVQVQSGEELRSYTSERLVLSFGSPSGVKKPEATEKNIAGLFKNLKLAVKPYEPSLVPLYVDEDLSKIAGVRSKVTLFGDNFQESGELQIMENHLSGIVTFNVSRFLKKGDSLEINLLPDLDEDSFLRGVSHFSGDRSLLAFLNGYLNDKLAAFAIENFMGAAFIKAKMKDISSDSLKALYLRLSTWNVKVIGKMDQSRSQASEGGVRVDEINPETMEVKSCPGLYCIGEAVDVMGKCGGYNLTFAFASGMVCGRNISITVDE